MYKIHVFVFTFILMCNCSNKNAMLSAGCDAKSAKKIALEHFDKHNKEGYKFRINKLEQDSLHYIIEIFLDEDIKEEVVNNDTIVTTIAGGGAKYTIDKKTCKIVAVKGYE